MTPIKITFFSQPAGEIISVINGIATIKPTKGNNYEINFEYLDDWKTKGIVNYNYTAPKIEQPTLFDNL